jgi:hypothetical protein
MKEAPILFTFDDGSTALVPHPTRECLARLTAIIDLAPADPAGFLVGLATELQATLDGAALRSAPASQAKAYAFAPIYMPLYAALEMAFALVAAGEYLPAEVLLGVLRKRCDAAWRVPIRVLVRAVMRGAQNAPTAAVAPPDGAETPKNAPASSCKPLQVDSGDGQTPQNPA